MSDTLTHDEALEELAGVISEATDAGARLGLSGAEAAIAYLRANPQQTDVLLNWHKCGPFKFTFREPSMDSDLRSRMLQAVDKAVAKLEADREVLYANLKVGDPDPNHSSYPRGICSASEGFYWCTRDKDHPGRHVAGNGSKVCAVWEAK